jgi:translation initiation factor IF-2
MTANIKQPDVISRPPVVVVLGHIDHGKTSLLMAIREFNILEKESGGITQHVGAYQIEHNSKKITFIDTPGHESFSAIRGRGSKIADIAVLVIDASEGVKKQTKEAIKHIKEAQLTTIVALNKMDKPGANPEMVKQQLSKEDILVESWGGQVPSVEMSAKTGQGITDLLDIIQLVAEVADLKAETGVLADGTIIEAYLDPKKGPTTTVLIENGTLKQGDYIGTDTIIGKIKNLGDFLQKEMKEANPSDPAVIIGFEGVPTVGQKFFVFKSYEEAKANLKEREIKQNTFEFDPCKKYLNLIIKGDAQGSLEGIEEVLKILPQDNVCIRIIRSEVGDIVEQDVKMAKTSGAIIIAFRVKKNKVAEISAENNKVKVYDFTIIYELAQKVRELMERKLTKEKERIDLGKIEVLAIFRTEKNRQIVGGNVIEGEVQKGASLEIYREEKKIGHGRIIELQTNKKDFDVVKQGRECGILYQGAERIKEEDILFVFREEYKQEEL